MQWNEKKKLQWPRRRGWDKHLPSVVVSFLYIPSESRVVIKNLFFYGYYWFFYCSFNWCISWLSFWCYFKNWFCFFIVLRKPFWEWKQGLSIFKINIIYCSIHSPFWESVHMDVAKEELTIQMLTMWKTTERGIEEKGDSNTNKSQCGIVVGVLD